MELHSSQLKERTYPRYFYNATIRQRTDQGVPYQFIPTSVRTIYPLAASFTARL